MPQINNDEIRQKVRENYGKVARSGSTGCGSSLSSGCCTASSAITAQDASIVLGYSDQDVNSVPAGANMGLGCGNPQAIASLQPGETVLDLGSGGGFDSFLAASAVGKQGHVIGVDMTTEMVSKSRDNALKTEYEHVEFRLGEIENLPVADSMVDVIISNCVINLSPEKERVFSEAFRVLKPGGRLAISDIVATADFPDSVKQNMALYTGCVAGASPINELENLLNKVGFRDIRIQSKDESKEVIRDWIPEANIEEYILSATIEAVKPIA